MTADAGEEPRRHQLLDRPPPTTPPTLSLGPILLPIALIVVLVSLAWAMDNTSYDIWGALIIGPVLILATMPLAYRAARREGDPGLRRIIIWGLLLKVVAGTIARYAVVQEVYSGFGDANAYHLKAIELVPQLRQLSFTDLGKISGTRFIDVLTGVVYAITGPSRLAGFLVFAWMGFLGSYLFYRGFRLGYPEADHKRYRLLIFLFPSMLFWSSSIGKEAWMTLVLGLCFYGLGSLLAHRAVGLVWLGLGLWGSAVVRPHLAIIVMSGLVLALPLLVGRPLPTEATGALLGYRIGRIALILLVLVAAGLVFSRAEGFFGIKDLDPESAQDVLDEASRRSSQGGSQFATISPYSPVGVVVAVGTVVFRPLPLEVANVQGIVAGLEGMLLALACYLSLARIARLPFELVRSPVASFAVGYSTAFILAFANLNNFGILARQRVQLLPMIFVLLCMPKARERVPGATSRPGRTPAKHVPGQRLRARQL